MTIRLNFTLCNVKHRKVDLQLVTIKKKDDQIAWLSFFFPFNPQTDIKKINENPTLKSSPHTLP
jgi:hypothetical protein